MKPLSEWLASEPLAQINKEAWLKAMRDDILDAAVKEVQELREEGEGDLRCAISSIQSLKTKP